MPQNNTSGKNKNAPKTSKLTLKVMKNLSTYYGLAVRRNSDSLENMRNEIWAAYYHKISTDEKPQHMYCPAGADSWCTYRKAEAAGEDEVKKYKHVAPLDQEAQEILKPIYEDLTSNDLLERCLGNNTQNNNESLNNCVWNFVPKHTFAGKIIMDIAAHSAACIFNEGLTSVLKIMEVMGVTIGNTAHRHAYETDRLRVKTGNRRSTEASKEARTARRDAQFGAQQQYEKEEGLMYGPGMAD